MRTVLTSSFVLILLLACEQKEPEALARINGRSISVEDFVFAYETSPRSTLTGSKEDVHQRVLDRMIDGILMAQEADRLGLDEDAGTARELDFLQDAAIRRELYRRQIRSAVTITEDQCREAFKREQTTLWVQHAVLDPDVSVPPHSWDPEWTHVNINPAVKTRTTTEFGPVDLMTWNQVDVKLESMLYAMQLNDVSEVIVRDGMQHVFRLVNVEKNVMATEDQFVARREHYLSALRKREEHQRAFSFVQQIMASEKLVLRGGTLNQLTEQLWAQRSGDEELTEDNPGELDPALNGLDQLDDAELASFNSGALSVGDFRFIYRMNPVQLSTDSPAALKRDLMNAVGIYVRDLVFSAEGRAQDLAEVQSVEEDFQYWRERLLATRLEQSIIDRLPDSPDTSFEMTAAAISQVINDLRKQATIQTDTAELLTIRTSDAGLSRRIDFFANQFN